jgi:prephenate dehydrogenase
MKLALIGVGLIGGSFAKALRAIGNVDRIVGFDVDAQALRYAAEIGILDDAAASAGAAIDGVDVVVVSTPVGSMQNIFREIAPHLSRTAIVTDTGSTKSSVIAAARRELGAAFERFVPGHPIAGSERSGVSASRADLFSNELFICTPANETDPRAMSYVEELWRSAGCRTERMSADKHDAVFAAVSHLPHVLAFALMAQVSDGKDGKDRLAAAGASFRDLTRIAASSPMMWADICVANRDALLAELDGYQQILDKWRPVIESGDTALLRSAFEAAAAARRALDASNRDDRS